MVEKNEVKLGLKNLPILPIILIIYIFMHLRQKVRLRPELSPKFLSTFPRKARPDWQLWAVAP